MWDTTKNFKLLPEFFEGGERNEFSFNWFVSFHCDKEKNGGKHANRVEKERDRNLP